MIFNVVVFLFFFNEYTIMKVYFQFPNQIVLMRIKKPIALQSKKKMFRVR